MELMLLEDDHENFELEHESKLVDDKYKKFFLYRDIIFSKVEIMGLVVETKVVGLENKNHRYIIYLDDGTSLVQCICWNNKNPTVFNHIRDQTKPGHFIRIYGYIDNYHGFEILIDNFGK